MPEELINVTGNIKAAPLRDRHDFLADTNRFKASFPLVKSLFKNVFSSF